MAILRFQKGPKLRKFYQDSSKTNDLFLRISQLDKAVMVSQHNKLAKQILESVNTYANMGLHTWECLTLIEDITQDVLRKWEVYHEEKK
jgi:hypothetical protein